MLGNVKAEEEPTPRETKAEHGLSRNLDFLSDLLVNSHATARNMGKDTAEKEHSSPGVYWKQQKEESWLPSKAGISDSPDGMLVPEEIIEAMVYHDLCLLVPDKALWMFIVHMARVPMKYCSLPELHLACGKMTLKTRLLVKLLSERQDNQGASALVDQCLQQGNIFKGLALDKGKEPTGEVEEILGTAGCVLLGNVQ